MSGGERATVSPLGRLARVAVPVLFVTVAIVVALVVTHGSNEPPRLSVTSGLAPESAELSSVYLRIDNAGGTDHLVGVATDAAGLVDLHSTDGNLMDTRGKLTVPGHATLSLEPGGAHIMLDHLAQPLTAGRTFTVTLSFARSEPITVPVEVVSYAELGRRLLPGAEAGRP